MAIRSIHIGPIEDFLQFDDTETYSDAVTPRGLILPVAPTVATAVVRKEDLSSSSLNKLVIGAEVVNGTAGRVLFESTGPVVADDAGLTYDGSTDKLVVSGSVGIGQAAPTAKLHIAAGSATANTAPLKLTTQASGLSTVEQGAFELIGNSLQFTQLAKRRGVSMGQTVRTSSTTIENSTTESAALITAEHGAGYLEVGKMEDLFLTGTIEQRVGVNAYLTVRIKYAGSTVHSFTTPALTLISSATPFELRVTTTCRSTGGTGTMQINSWFEVADIMHGGGNSLPTIDTTTAQDTTVTVQWAEADASDIFIVQQGRVLCIDTNK